MVKKVLIIGVGGIGFRHFQALFSCRERIEIYVVDVNDDAIRQAKEYENTLNTDIDVFYSKKISDVPELICVAIIATPSLPRRSVFEDLVKNHTVEKIIFEKFLFPKMDDYDYVEKIIKEKGIEAYVDCVARIYDFFNIIKDQVKDCRYFTVSIRGSNWGLACNAIHELHLIAYLAGMDTRDITCFGNLENVAYASKRDGYIEFFGKIIGRLGDKVSFSLECNHSDDPFVYEFYTDKYYYCVNQTKRTFSKITFDGLGEIVTAPADFLYVSQITNRNVDCLLRNEKPFLPSYEDSIPLHKALLNVFLEHYKTIENRNTDICPIT